MTEPTDAELWQFYMTLPGANPLPPEAMKLIEKWGYSPPDEKEGGQHGADT